MYIAHFGLTEPPFSITPDPRYLYMSERHREALAHLLYGIGEGGGFVQLTGEVGTGKTTLCRCLLEQLPPDVDVALILNPQLTSVELLATVCDELKIAYPPGTTSHKALVDALYRYLLEAHERGRGTVLVIDEAQDLSADVLEEIRLLTNLETARQKLLQVILIGQPELSRLMESPALRQVAQRVTARYHLAPLSKAETQAYIRHRLEVAGGDDGLFGAAAMRQIHRLSGGVPRLINVICDRALLGAYVQNRKRVNVGTARRAATEVLGRPARRWWRPAAAIAKVAGLLAAAVAVSVATVVVISERPSILERLSRGEPNPASSAPTTPGDTAVAHVDTELRGERLGDLLRDLSLPSDKGSALGALYGHWRPDSRELGRDVACARGRLRELGCLEKTGAWRTLRRFDLPAVLELVGDDGEKRYAALTALRADTATLAVGDLGVTVSISELERYWDGSFVLLWKAPPIAAFVLRPGSRGPDVAWVRRRLEEIDGTPVRGEPRDLFSEEMRERVIAFQRSRSLSPDGIVGVETLVELSVALDDPDVPTLSSAER